MTEVSSAVYVEDGKPVNKISHFSGSMSISGHITVMGSCCYKHARELVINEVMEQVYKEVKKQVSTW